MSNNPTADTSAQSGSQAVSGAFRAQTQPTIRRPGVTLTATLGAAPTPLNDTPIPSVTLIRCIYLECVVTAAGNSATVAFAGDAPSNLFSSVNFHDAGGTSYVGNFDSYTLRMANKWFGFVNSGDMLASAVYSATSGSGATAGSVTEVFRIPIEIVKRTGVGSLRATTTQSPLVLSLTLNQLSNIYTTQPTNAPSVSVVISFGGYWNQSGSADTYAVPAGIGTVNYINRASIPGSIVGQQEFNLPNIGLGNEWRNLMLINYLTGGARSDTAFPTTLQIKYRQVPLDQWSQLLWKHWMSENYGYNATTQDTANGLDTGVYVHPFNQDFVNAPGQELGYGYLDTGTGDDITLLGSWATASTLYEVLNFLAVAGPVSAIQGH